MSKAIASRIAGLRLAAIMVILLVPIVLLSVLTVRNLQQDIRIAELEIKGNQLARQIMAMAIEIAEQTATAESLQSAFAGAGASAQDLGLAEALAALQQQIGKTDSEAVKLRLLSEFVLDVGARSHLLFDGQAESRFLALANIEELPPLLVKFHAFHSYLQDAISSNGVDASEVKLLTYRLGTLGETVERARHTLNAAQVNSADAAAYDEALKLADKIGNGVSVTMDVLATSAPGSEWLTLSMIARQNIDAEAKYKSERAVWETTTRLLDGVLNTRLKDLTQNLLGLIGIAVACVAVAALAALGMFHSTLRRLDLVEAEKKRADAARIEAEQMGARLVTVNDDISALNRDLSNNMQKLKAAQDELLNRGRMEQLGQLTATVAHEIRNPLGAVRTSAFLIGRKVAGKNLGIESQLERINKGIGRCDSIITQLLDFSRTKEVDTKPSDLDGWLEAVLQEDVEQFPAAVRIECLLGLGGRDVNFDQQRLRRAIGNLISNSCEAMVGNGQQPAAHAVTDPTIRIATSVEGGMVHISIADNGPGMSDEVLGRIREPLFTTKNFGTGLGVPAVEQIARQHGGALHISSALGQGANFTITLPLEAARQKEAA